MKVTEVTYEDTLEDKEEFNKAHPNSEWKLYEHDEKEMKEIWKKMHFLINTQNGQDVDEYSVGVSSPLVKYLKDDLKDKSVLILGTGTGREMKTARELGASNVEATTLGNRNRMYAEEVVGEHPVVCDMHMMPWEDNTFDVIAGFQVFEHSYMPIGFLLECNRLLKNGGMLCLETPDGLKTNLDSWLHHVLCPTGRQMYHMLIKTGFKPVIFNKYSLVNIDHKLIDKVPDIDRPDVYVMTKSIKMDPMKYERGDMARYTLVQRGDKFRL